MVGEFRHPSDEFRGFEIFRSNSDKGWRITRPPCFAVSARKLTAATISENVNNQLVQNSSTYRSKTQYFQILCEEVMCKAMKMIDVDKIFLVKSNEGAVHVLNALKLCIYWKVVNEYIMDIYKKEFDVQLFEGNIFGSIQAFIRRCKDLYEICQVRITLIGLKKMHFLKRE